MSHAKLFSPSKAEGWFACSGRPVMEAAYPDTAGKDAKNGTARHAVCAYCLTDNANAMDLVGYYVDVAANRIFMPEVDDDLSNAVEYIEDWVAEDQDYVDTFRKLAEGGDLYVEQCVDFRRFIECTAEGDGFGTGDAIVLKPLADSTYELIVGDRKTGYHEVPVERNKQLLLYALGAYDEHSLVYNISRVRLIIHQRSAREWDCSTEDLLAFAQEARSRAISVQNAVSMHGKVDQAEWERTFLNQQPSEDACRYCKAMATCPSMQKKVQDTLNADFVDMAGGEVELNAEGASDIELGTCMAAAGLIEDWLKAVRAEVERRLLAGQQVPGWGLELGKQGNRAWKDKAAAEAKLKAMRLKVEEMYDLELISPTTAEKLADTSLVKPPKSKKKAETGTPSDKAIGPRQWLTLQELITRAPPKPSVKPAAAITEPYTPPVPSADDFEPVADEESLC